MVCGWFQWIQRLNCVYVLRTVIASWFVAWLPSDFNRVARSELPNLGCQSQVARTELQEPGYQSWVARASFPSANCQSQAARTRLPEPGYQSRVAIAELPEPGWHCQVAKAGLPERGLNFQDAKERVARAGLPELNCQSLGCQTGVVFLLGRVLHPRAGQVAPGLLQWGLHSPPQVPTYI